MSTNLSRLIAIAIFFFALAMGIFLSSRKPLWHDELYTLLYSSSWPSYTEILSGNPGPWREGNVSPAYYISQKLSLDLTGYAPPATLIDLVRNANSGRDQSGAFSQWVNGMPWHFEHRETQWKSRLSEIFFMGLFLSLGFLTFFRWFGWPGGALFMLQSLSSFMIWAHWAEARPYGLWMLLTLLQGCILLDPKAFRPLTVYIVQIVLGLTTVQAAPQILLFSILYSIGAGVRWNSLRQQIPLTFLPLTEIAYYFTQSRRGGLTYFLATGPLDVIFANIPIERWPWIALGFFLVWRLFRAREWRHEFNSFFLFSLALIAMGTVLVLRFWLFPAPPEIQKGEFSNRYLSFLTPIGILAATYVPFLFDRTILKLKHYRWRIAFWVLVLALAAARVWKVSQLIPNIYS